MKHSSTLMEILFSQHSNCSSSCLSALLALFLKKNQSHTHIQLEGIKPFPMLFFLKDPSGCVGKSNFAIISIKKKANNC